MGTLELNIKYDGLYIKRDHDLCRQRPLNFPITPGLPTLPLSGCSTRAQSSEV